VAKAVKAKYPAATPFAGFNPGGFSYISQFMQSYGVDPTWGSFRLINGTVTSIWTMPQMKQALDYYRRLYKEGVLDATFATNKVEDWIDRYENKQLLVWGGAMYASQPNTAYYTGKGKSMFFIDVPTVVAPGVDPKQTVMPVNQVGRFAMGISAKSRNPDAAARVIEAFASPEFKTFITFGREGVEYTMKDGKRVFDNAKYNESHVFKSLFRFMWDFHTTESAEATIVTFGQGNIKDPALLRKYLEGWRRTRNSASHRRTRPGSTPSSSTR